jgi:hypothetical protein
MMENETSVAASATTKHVSVTEMFNIFLAASTQFRHSGLRETSILQDDMNGDPHNPSYCAGMY